MVNTDDLFDYTNKRIADQAVADDPFPHFYLRDVFREDVLAGIHGRWPQPDAFESSAKNGNMESERFYFTLDTTHIKQLEPESRIFWESVAAWLTSPKLLEIAVSKYGASIPAFLGELFGETDWSIAQIEALTRFNISLVWDVTGYRLLPHADDPRVLLNFLFYLPPDASQGDLGTTLYVPKDPTFVSQGEARHFREDFDAVQTFPYLPNTMFSFMRSPRSFHGMEGVNDANTTRKLMLYSLMLRDEALEAASEPASRSAVAAS